MVAFSAMRSCAVKLVLWPVWHLFTSTAVVQADIFLSKIFDILLLITLPSYIKKNMILGQIFHDYHETLSQSFKISDKMFQKTNETFDFNFLDINRKESTSLIFNISSRSKKNSKSQKILFGNVNPNPTLVLILFFWPFD